MFEIIKNSIGYYLIYNYNFRTDKAIASILNVSLKEYHKLGINNNGFMDIEETSKELYFNTRKDANNFIELLTPYIIINKLGE
ncbi:MAG: hypothetical protein ACOCP8_01855 [archaeon]